MAAKVQLEAHETYVGNQAPLLNVSSSASDGVPAQTDMFSLKNLGLIPLYIIVIALYGLALLCSMIWMLTGPVLPGGRRVLRTGLLDVEQLYSGLALSALLTPAAVIIRTLSHELGLLHPFSIAHSKPVSIKDLDKIMDPNAMSILSIARYSWWAACVQTVLIASGALLVPVGTLMVTTGPYAARALGTATVGMPTWNGNGISLDNELAGIPYASYEAVPANASGDTFAWNVANIAMSTFTTQPGNISTSDSILGPVTTGNITFQTGVMYHGLVTYSWAANCESAADEILYIIQHNSTDTTQSNVSFSMPTYNVTWSYWLSQPNMFMFANATERAGLSYDQYYSDFEPVPYGGTLYFGTGAYGNVTKHYPMDNTGLTIDNENDLWVTRMKCTPSLKWTVSTCTWDGMKMGNCTETLHQNVTGLSVDGLNKLSGYVVPAAISAVFEDHVAYGMAVTSLPFLYWPDATGPNQFRAPGINEYENFISAFANGIAIATTAGYYGTAQVPTTGEPEHPVYIARMYIVAMTLVILVAVAAFSVIDLLLLVVRASPLRKASFVTVAAAVQNKWWDDVFRGKSSMSRAGLVKSVVGQHMIQFGEELGDGPTRIGLAPQVRRVNKRRSAD